MLQVCIFMVVLHLDVIVINANLFDWLYSRLLLTDTYLIRSHICIIHTRNEFLTSSCHLIRVGSNSFCRIHCGQRHSAKTPSTCLISPAQVNICLYGVCTSKRGQEWLARVHVDEFHRSVWIQIICKGLFYLISMVNKGVGRVNVV